MIQLEASQTLSGVAGTASAITWTFSEDEVVTATDTFKAPQGVLASSVATLITASSTAGAVVLIKSMHGVNTTGSNVSGVKFFKGGTGAANQISPTMTVPANGGFTYETGNGWSVYDGSGVRQSVGSTGPSGTVAVGTVTNIGTTGPPTVTNVGTGSAAILNFGLQQGATGTTGPAGVVQDVLATDATAVVTGTTAHPTVARGAITGDVGIPAGSNTSTLATVGPGAVGPIGDASHVAATSTDSKGRVTALTAVLITPAAIGAPSGSGTSIGSNTGDQNDLTLPLETTGISPAYSGTTTQKQFNINLNRGKVKLLNYIGASFVADDGSGTVGTDMGAVFNAIHAIFVTNKGGSLEIPGGILMRQTTPIIVTQSGVEIDGGGCGYNSDTGNFRDALGCALIWRGSASQIMFLAQPSGTGGVGQNLKNFRLSGISLDGRANTTGGGDVSSVRAAKGLVIRSASGWHVSDIYVQDCDTSNIELDVLAPGTIGEAHDCTRGVLERWCIRTLDGGGAGGTVAPGVGLVMNGSASANTCYNEITAGQIVYSGVNTGKPAINMINTDSNRFNTINLFSAQGGGGSNWGCVVQGGTTTVTSSRANRFDNFSPGANGMILCGTAGGIRPDGTADASFNFTAAAGNNLIDENTENGEPYIYRGTGVPGPIPGASGGSTFPFQGFRCGGGALISKGNAAAISTTHTQIVGVSVPKWFFAPLTQVELDVVGLLSANTTASTLTITVRVGTTTLTGVIPAQFVLSNTTTSAKVSQVVSFKAIITCLTAGSSGTILGGIGPTGGFAAPNVAAGAAVTTHSAITGSGISAAVALNTTVGNVIEVTAVSGNAAVTFTPLSSNIKVVN